MACFKDWLISESFKNNYQSLLESILIERACFDALKIVLEAEEDEDEEFVGDLESEKYSGSEDAKPVRIEPSQSEPSREEISSKEASTIRQMQKELKDAILVLRWNAMAKRAKQIEEIRSLRDQYVKEYGVPKGIKIDKVEDPDSIQENTEEDEDDIDFLNYMAKSGSVPKSIGNANANIRSSFDVMQAAPLLEKLGYINVDNLRREGLEDEEIKNAVTHALFKAANEDGNEVPPDVDNVLNPTELKKATDDFFLLTREIFKRSFKKIVRSQMAYIVGGKQGPQKASKLFDPGYFDPKETGYRDNDQIIDDIANRFSIKMLENFTTREVSNSTGKPQSWLKIKKKSLGQGGVSELESEEFVVDLMTYIQSHLKNFKSNEDREAKLSNSPSSPSRDLDVWGGNRDKKAAMINSDIEKNNLEFYKKYMDESDDKREVMNNRLQELKSKLKETKKLSKDEHEEKWRLEILQQIFFLHSRHSESLPLDSKQISSTLNYFRSNFLGHKYRSESFFGAMGRKTDDGNNTSDIIGFGGDATARAGDSGSKRDIGAGRELNPASSVANNDAKRFLHEKLLEALNALRNSGGVDNYWAGSPIKMGQLYSMAVCVHWDLGNCSPNNAITNVDAFSNLVLALNKDGSITGEKDQDGRVKTGCVDQLWQLVGASGRGGKSVKQTADEVAAILGKPPAPDGTKQPSEGAVRGWIEKGLEFICNYIRGSKIRGVQSFGGSLAPPSLINRRFDSSRQSPLSSRMRPAPTEKQEPSTDPNSDSVKESKNIKTRIVTDSSGKRIWAN